MWAISLNGVQQAVAQDFSQVFILLKSYVERGRVVVKSLNQSSGVKNEDTKICEKQF